MVLIGYSLYKRVVIGIHNIFRDIGGTRLFFDSVSVFLGIMFCLCKPSLLYEYSQVISTSKSYSYGGGSPRKVIEVCKTLYDSSVETSTSANRHSSEPLKVAVFVHGGAWGSGSVWMYRLIAQGYARVLGAQYTAVLGYPVYPESTILQQRDCVLEALSLLYSNSDEIFKSDPNLILIGHSSGANISALALLESSEKGQVCADAFIGVGGVYNIEHHYEYERGRGVHQVSPMAAAARGRHNFGECSPQLKASRLAAVSRDLLHSVTPSIDSPARPNAVSTTKRVPRLSEPGLSLIDPSSVDSAGSNTNQRGRRTVPTVCLLHGLHDTVVPPSATETFAASISGLLGAQNVHTVYTKVCALFDL